MANISRQGTRTLFAKNSKPEFKIDYDLLLKQNLFSINIPDHEGRVIRISLPENEVKDALKTWKRLLGKNVTFPNSPSSIQTKGAEAA